MASTSVTLNELLARVENIETTWQLIWCSGTGYNADAYGVLVPKKYKYIKIVSNYDNDRELSRIIYTGSLESFTSDSHEYVITKKECADTDLRNEFYCFNFVRDRNAASSDNQYMLFGKLK